MTAGHGLGADRTWATPGVRRSAAGPARSWRTSRRLSAAISTLGVLAFVGGAVVGGPGVVVSVVGSVLLVANLGVGALRSRRGDRRADETLVDRRQAAAYAETED